MKANKLKNDHPLIKIVSVLSTIGISLGIIVLIVSFSALNGFENELNKLIQSTPISTRDLSNYLNENERIYGEKMVMVDDGKKLKPVLLTNGEKFALPKNITDPLHLKVGDEVVLNDGSKYVYVLEEIGQSTATLDMIKEMNGNISIGLFADHFVPELQHKFGKIYDDIKLVKEIVNITMLIIISISCFNLFATLLLAVKEKEREIAILRTIGYNKLQIISLFIRYGLVVSKNGLLFGLIGVPIAYFLPEIYHLIEMLSQFNMNGYFVQTLPSEVKMFDVITIYFSTLAIIILSSIIPAIKAAKTDPVKILR